MAWKYSQRTGSLMDPRGEIIATGYSGHGTGLNNPYMQHVEGMGPIPTGSYIIGPPKDPIDHLGPVAMPLTERPGGNYFKRSAFFIHGDNASADHTASDGCVILARNIRQMIADSDDRELIVVA